MCILLDDIITAMVRFRCKGTNIIGNEQLFGSKIWKNAKSAVSGYICQDSKIFGFVDARAVTYKEQRY